MGKSVNASEPFFFASGKIFGSCKPGRFAVTARSFDLQTSRMVCLKTVGIGDLSNRFQV